MICRIAITHVRHHSSIPAVYASIASLQSIPCYKTCEDGFWLRDFRRVPSVVGAIHVILPLFLASSMSLLFIALYSLLDFDPYMPAALLIPPSGHKVSRAHVQDLLVTSFGSAVCLVETMVENNHFDSGVCPSASFV